MARKYLKKTPRRGFQPGHKPHNSGISDSRWKNGQNSRPWTRLPQDKLHRVLQTEPDVHLGVDNLLQNGARFLRPTVTKPSESQLLADGQPNERLVFLRSLLGCVTVRSLNI